MTLALPPRYEAVRSLGQGGGGEVWAVRDRRSQQIGALKVLAAGASERELGALVREATALSGLEGLGLPRVLEFGRLSDGRAYLLRELVAGESLAAAIERGDPAPALLGALMRAASQLTVLHRAGLLHGDFKPANVIVTPEGHATLVDLGLAAPWRERGTTAEGLTPRYAAPELLEGKPLTVRAEVYALGIAIEDVLECSGARALTRGRRSAIAAVAARATALDPSARFPSADELASALGHAAGLTHAGETPPSLLWPIVGMDAAATELLDRVVSLPKGGALVLAGPDGAGRTALLCRLAWSLGVRGAAVVRLEPTSPHALADLRRDLATLDQRGECYVLCDDAEQLPSAAWQELLRLRAQGLCLVIVGERSLAGAVTFAVPPLEQRVAEELVHRTIPSLPDRVVQRVVAATEARPGRLRRAVHRLSEQAVVSESDAERVLAAHDDSAAPISTPIDRVLAALDRGRYKEAAVALEQAAAADPLQLAVARARLDLGLGDAAAAIAGLDAIASARVSAPGDVARAYDLVRVRAELGVGHYARALELAEPLLQANDLVASEARAFAGLARSYSNDAERAFSDLAAAVSSAIALGSSRVEGVARASLGVALQRADRLDDARGAYLAAIEAATAAGDAATIATAQLNLAGLSKVAGDIAGAIGHLEAAADMGERSGRRATVRNALLNLANTDLYLGRVGRARGSIERLAEQRAQLSPAQRAQLSGLEAELAARQGDVASAISLYATAASAYEALGHTADAAEALMESVLVAAPARHGSLAAHRATLARAQAALSDGTAHRPMFELAQARLAELAGDEQRALAHLARALDDSRSGGQREWEWRALEARAEIEEAGGQPLRARRDREEALSVLEAISARLPRDLREVYWNDPRRRALRAAVQATLGAARTEFNEAERASRAVGTATQGPSVFTPPLPETTLARILEVNADIAGLHDLDRLAARVVDHAVDLLRAERGHLVLTSATGQLELFTSRARGADAPDAEFSRSIAARVIASGQPVVTASAREDERLADFASVHHLALQSVACVPVRSPSGAAIGALYVETRRRAARHFAAELHTLEALGTQVAIAIETARLVAENSARQAELERANQELASANEHVRELLDDRTEKLKRTRQKLRDARDTLLGHFGYQGLVGTSDAMRRVYAIIDRVKDTDVPVLLTGESGTGKEVVARAIHQASARKKGKLLAINCGAVPENLLESELFGSVKGAFTGADRDRNGLIREATGGSVLLDEIGEMPHKMQAGLLRVLQEHKVRPVGGSVEESVDVRMIFATHRDLEALVAAGTFREDLYYRVQVVEIRIPPLRDRAEDLPQLVDHFLGLFAARYKREKGSVSREALRRLSSHPWPGNVRQLEHVLLNAWVMAEHDELDVEDFELRLGDKPPPPASRTEAVPAKKARKSTVSQHRRDERERILEALHSANWNRVKAAELVGLPRRTFYRRLRDYGIQ